MHTAIFAKVVVDAAEVVAHGLYSGVELVGYFVHRAVGQTVLEAAQFVEGDSLRHNSKSFMDYCVVLMLVKLLSYF